MWHKLNHGSIKRPGDLPIKVTYVVREFENGTFRGRINIAKSKDPATQFKRGYKPGSPREVWTLETALGTQISICFTHPGGAFDCLDASEGRTAVAEYNNMLKHNNVPLDSLLKDEDDSHVTPPTVTS